MKVVPPSRVYRSAANADESPNNWTVEDSVDLYGVDNWGSGYFAVSDNGELQVKTDDSISVSIMDIIAGMRERGLDMPVMLRIENLLDLRIQALNEGFAKAIENINYKNVFRGVFPIKVNQQCHVIEEIADFGAKYHHGFEAGSKAELIIALAKLKDNDSLLICNGYKDAEFVELGLYATQMGMRCIFVLETPTELPIILERSKALGIEPILGVRIKPTVKVDGHWNEDSGDRSIFGLSTASLMKVIEELKQAELLHCLQMLHCHLGSQIPNIRNIRHGVLEACRFYIGLVEAGAAMGYLDLGGGLAVDYQGHKSNSTHSMNYQLQEYCADVVETIVETLDPLGIEHPVIITESGRATVAYSSMLLFNVLDVRDHRPVPLPEELPENSPDLVQNLWQTLKAVSIANLQETFNDAFYYREEIRQQFQRGQAKLLDRALGDNLHLAILEKIASLLPQASNIPDELEELPELLADVYYGNFSLFQSLPDIWAIDQIFPVMPIHRLQEMPERRAVIADITCDCDGKIDSFTHSGIISNTLPLHPLKDDEEYYLGVFLVGAYQETLGDLHNLFGDTNVVSVHVHADGSFDFVREFQGDSIADVLSYVEYDTKNLTEQFRQRAENAVRDGKIPASKRREILNAFKASLDGYTYFESE